MMKEIFSEIYYRNAWGDEESVSGPGSSVQRASAFREELAKLLARIHVTSLLDAGCGDHNWMKEMNLDSLHYIGADVVPELIARNQQDYSSEIKTFVNLDVTRDELPRVDVIFCRDCLVHFSYKDIFAALRNFKQSSSTYLLTNTFTRFPENFDIPTGDWRQLNLQRHPFYFPAPIESIDERCLHSGGIYADKHLALWALKDLPI
jgi:hypothetical protein